MKKMLILSLALTVFSTTFFSSCSETEDQIAITDQLLTDQAFTEAVQSSVEIFVTAQENNWLAHGQTIADLMRKSASEGLSAAEETELEGLLGMTREAYIQQMTDFGVSLNSLLEKYPALQEMTATERQAVFSEVIAQHDELAAYMADLQSTLRACPLQDICNLVVDLAVAIGGPILCDIIAGAIPVIGPALCGIVLDIATDLLVGICNGLPC